MGREVRRVPATWEHPKKENGRYLPLYDRDYLSERKEWEEGLAQWIAGLAKYGDDGKRPDGYRLDIWGYIVWSGSCPAPGDYMPQWPESECTHLMMYETTSEGTPISPAFETPEELARWLADNNASAFGGMTAGYEHWLRVAKGGYACSMVGTSEGLTSGVEGLSN